MTASFHAHQSLDTEPGSLELCFPYHQHQFSMQKLQLKIQLAQTNAKMFHANYVNNFDCFSHLTHRTHFPPSFTMHSFHPSCLHCAYYIINSISFQFSIHAISQNCPNSNICVIPSIFFLLLRKLHLW